MAAQAQPVVQTFFVTLKRSFIGKPWFHKRTLESLGLRRRMQCVEKPNNACIRGELQKVAHLVRVETDQMYYHRKLAERQAAQLQPPLIVRHAMPAQLAGAPPASASSSSRGSTPADGR